MHRRLTALLLTVTGLFGAAGLAGCSSEDAAKNLAPKPFCEAVAAYENTLVRTTTDDKVKAAERQLPALRKVLALAPTDIRSDVRTMVDAYERVVAGEEVTPAESAELDPVVKRVERYGVDKCQLLKQQTGGGVV